jgi:hypothetical protein
MWKIKWFFQCIRFCPLQRHPTWIVFICDLSYGHPKLIRDISHGRSNVYKHTTPSWLLPPHSGNFKHDLFHFKTVPKPQNHISTLNPLISSPFYSDSSRKHHDGSAKIDPIRSAYIPTFNFDSQNTKVGEKDRHV